MVNSVCFHKHLKKTFEKPIPESASCQEFIDSSGKESLAGRHIDNAMKSAPHSGFTICSLNKNPSATEIYPSLLHIFIVQDNLYIILIN